MRVEFSTTEYEFSHGRKPRGEGCWVFFAKGNRAKWLSTSNQTYGEAKKRARAWAVEQGVSVVVVGP
jgi:hypothetical protein